MIFSKIGVPWKRKKLKVEKKIEDETDEIVTEVDEEFQTQLDNIPKLFHTVVPAGIKVCDEDHGYIKQTLSKEKYWRPAYIPQDGYPRQLSLDWTSHITAIGEIDIMQDIWKDSKNESIRKLSAQKTMLKANYKYQAKKGNEDSAQDNFIKAQDTENLLNEVHYDENDSFIVSNQLMIYGNSKKELDKVSESLEDTMSGYQIDIIPAYNRPLSAFLSMQPFNFDNRLKGVHRNMDRRALAASMPLLSAEGVFEGGIPFAINKNTGDLEFFSSFGNHELSSNNSRSSKKKIKVKNYNSGIIGVPGSGKSVLMKILEAREASLGNVYFRNIDIEGEMVVLTKKLGGTNIPIGPESKVIINPCAINFSEIELTDSDEELDFLKEKDKYEIFNRDGVTYVRFIPLLEKVNELLDLFKIIIVNDGELDNYEKNMLEKAIFHVFKEKGITTHPSSLFEENATILFENNQINQAVRKRKAEPTLSDINEYLVEHYMNDVEAGRVINGLAPFLHTGSKPMFDGQTYLGPTSDNDMNYKRVINFNISSIEEGPYRPVAFHIILNYIWEHWVKNPELALLNKKVFVDEIWQLIDNKQTVSFLEKLTRRSRKRNAGITWASQDFIRILENPYARALISSSFTMMFFELNSVDRQKVQESFPQINDGMLDILLNNPDTGEGILFVGDKPIWIQVNPSEREMLFVESNKAHLNSIKDAVTKTKDKFKA